MTYTKDITRFLLNIAGLVFRCYFLPRLQVSLAQPALFLHICGNNAKQWLLQLMIAEETIWFNPQVPSPTEKTVFLTAKYCNTVYLDRPSNIPENVEDYTGNRQDCALKCVQYLDSPRATPTVELKMRYMRIYCIFLS